MESQKPLQFNGTAGGYFVVFLVALVMSYIPILGWAFALNFMANWAAENSVVNGKKVAYKAGYGESLKFVFINTLLIIVTLGIYMFWFVPKAYRYVADHISYSDAPAVAAPAAAEATTSVEPSAPVTPAEPAAAEPQAPTPPTNPTPPVV